MLTAPENGWMGGEDRMKQMICRRNEAEGSEDRIKEW
jgi:hypothetical protein